MGANFPNSPALDETFMVGQLTYQWNGIGWAVTTPGGAGGGGSTGGGASVTTDDAPPIAPRDGELWWKSSTGAFYIWYDDGNSQQWVQVASGATAENADIPVIGSVGSTTSLLTIQGVHDDTYLRLDDRSSADVQGPIIELYKNSPAPAVNLNGGEVAFFHNLSDGAKKYQAYISAYSLNVTPGQDGAELLFGIRNNGGYWDMMDMWGPGNIEIYQGRLCMPATQNNLSTSPNTLDDYEEGSWTPVLRFNGLTTGITYSRQTGRYQKIGNKVTVWGWIVLSAKGTATGAATIAGLPFTPASNLDFYSGCVGYFSSAAGSTITIMVPAPNTYLNLYLGNAQMTDTSFLANTNVGFHVEYETNQ